MTVEKLTIKGETVDYCIRDALQRVGLPADETLIRIHQREKTGWFGFRPAVVSITYDRGQAEEVSMRRRIQEIKSRIQFRLDVGIAQIKVPSSFYGEGQALGKDVLHKMLTDFLEEHKMFDPEPEAIEEILTDFQCQYNFKPIQKLECIDLNQRGAKIHLRIADDLMSAEAIVFHGRHGARLEEVLSVLKEKGVVKGIRRKNIERVLRSHYQGFFEIAKGLPALHDKPGEIEKFFQEDEHKEFASMMASLTIDTRSVKDINIADRNQLLMTIGDITVGADGYQIDGAVVQKKTLTSASSGIQLGNGVYATDNGKEIFSKESGHIAWRAEDSFIDVEPLYVVEGNVDYSEGNIIGFVGKVLIKGDVKAKFSVIAEGDIEIHGSVEDAVIKSTIGNVYVAGGIVHRSEGYVQAKKTCHCMIVTNGNIRADKIIVEKEVMNSELDAQSSIEILGNPGVAVGGKLSARHLLKANSIGSERWVSTLVRVGDVSDLKSKLRGIKQTEEKIQAQLHEAEQIRHILQSRKKTRELSDSQTKQLMQVSEEIPKQEERLEDLEEEKEFILEEIERRKDGKLEVIKVVHPQTDIHIFDAHFMPPTAEKYTGFRCRKSEIIRYSL